MVVRAPPLRAGKCLIRPHPPRFLDFQIRPHLPQTPLCSSSSTGIRSTTVFVLHPLRSTPDSFYTRSMCVCLGAATADRVGVYSLYDDVMDTTRPLTDNAPMNLNKYLYKMPARQSTQQRGMETHHSHKATALLQYMNNKRQKQTEHLCKHALACISTTTRLANKTRSTLAARSQGARKA